MNRAAAPRECYLLPLAATLGSDWVSQRRDNSTAIAGKGCPGAVPCVELPTIDEDTARKVVELGSHEMGEGVEYGDFLLMKVEEDRQDGDVERAYYALVDEETGADTGERIGAPHYVVNESNASRRDA